MIRQTRSLNYVVAWDKEREQKPSQEDTKPSFCAVVDTGLLSCWMCCYKPYLRPAHKDPLTTRVKWLWNCNPQRRAQALVSQHLSQNGYGSLSLFPKHKLKSIREIRTGVLVPAQVLNSHRISNPQSYTFGGLGLGAGCSWARWACGALEGATSSTA